MCHTGTAILDEIIHISYRCMTLSHMHMCSQFAETIIRKYDTWYGRFHLEPFWARARYKIYYPIQISRVKYREIVL